MTLLFTIVEFREAIESRKKITGNVERKIFVCIRKAVDSDKYKNFKYYIMDFNYDTDECSVRFGGIGKAPKTHEYNIRAGKKKELEKLRKGYRELTPAEYEAGFAQYGNLQA